MFKDVKIWTTEDWRRIPIDELTTLHAENILKNLEKRVSQHFVDYDIEFVIDTLCPIYWDIEKILKKRRKMENKIIINLNKWILK